MIIENLLEDTELHDLGVPFYPDPKENAYILVRRNDTQACINARRKIISSMPPAALLQEKDVDSRNKEMLRRMVSEYYVAGLSGFYSESQEGELQYTKDLGVLIFHSDKALSLLDGIVATSVDSSKYIVRQRNIHLEIIKKYIEFDFDLPTLEDKLDHLELNCNNDTDTYNNSTVKINDIESEVISGFYNACKYRKENEYLTKEQINESYELYVTMTSNYDYIEMIKTLDSFYLNLKIKRDKAMSKQVESNDN